ncbi:hypothetical protein HAX54_025940, partial [Datura stramonium]|nr:hypothetical protein [Datura stramonium]
MAGDGEGTAGKGAVMRDRREGESKWVSPEFMVTREEEMTGEELKNCSGRSGWVWVWVLPARRGESEGEGCADVCRKLWRLCGGFWPVF